MKETLHSAKQPNLCFCPTPPDLFSTLLAMANDSNSHSALLDRVKRHRSVMTRPFRQRYNRTITLESFMAYGLGSGLNGATVSILPCGNATSRGQTLKLCPNAGILTCSKCSLVKYCSPRCQIQHSPIHRAVCQNVFLNNDWRRCCSVEQRDLASNHKTVQILMPIRHMSWSNSPAYDCIQLNFNEGLDAKDIDFRLCLVDSPDFLNVVRTVNSLPRNYRGKCDFLLNNADAVVTNRNLLILHALLSPGPSIEEAAELATHLMYSAMLPATGAAYLRRCVRATYGQGPKAGRLSFQSSADTRGKGKLYCMQLSAAIKRPLEMFFSVYEVDKASRSVRSTLWNPHRADERGKFLTSLQPGHRLAFIRFWETGESPSISLDTAIDMRLVPRLSFSVQGDWLGQPEFNPLRSFDVSRVLESGRNHKIEPADIMGCLFFHLKDELMEFATRIKHFHINIHLTQFDPKILSRGLAIGALPAFDKGCFDRIDLSTMIDSVGVQESLTSWAPLLNRQNNHACIIMRSDKWYTTYPKATARTNPHIIELLRRKCQGLSLKHTGLKRILTQDLRSPMLSRLVHSLDAFLDHERSFQDYLNQQGMQSVLDKTGLQLRNMHRVHPKRYGVVVEFPDRKLPELTKEEFYNAFTLGAADFPVRFVEFESILGQEVNPTSRQLYVVHE
ncbi:hypothetical protein AX15_007432 [Amanita polypyramis BW_CC]|nr:hypothetical protein AX15_007432 [Amanita polypyramis BW_CC]